MTIGLAPKGIAQVIWWVSEHFDWARMELRLRGKAIET